MNVITLVTIFGLILPIQGFAVDTNTMAQCPQFKSEYNSCKKIAGMLPDFFQSVAIIADSNGFVFTTQTTHGPLVTKYIPDGVARLGSDYHYTGDGQVLANLRSHDATYCSGGTLFGYEVTFLPDNTIATEEYEMKITDSGALTFKVRVDKNLLLEGECR